MKLRRYLDRIAFRGDARPSIGVLTAIQQAHVLAVPFENFDVHFGRPVSMDIEAAYEKIVIQKRGGWCYEQNGLLGWALTEIGFDVTRVAAAVMRQDRGQIADANHLCLKIVIPTSGLTYLVDVGFGGSLLCPIELHEAEYRQAPFQVGLRRLDHGHWRFWENIGRGEFSFDFQDQAANEDALQAKSQFLQTDPSSGFVLNTVTQIRLPEQHKSLRGRVFTVAGRDEIQSTILDTREQLVEVLANHFSLNVPGVADLWTAINARHEQLFRDKAIEDTFEVRARANR